MSDDPNEVADGKSIEYVKDKPKPLRPADGLYSPEMLAERWAFSEKKVRRILERYRSHSLYRDFGAAENVYTKKRRFSVPRISAELLAIIESDFGPKKPRK